MLRDTPSPKGQRVIRDTKSTGEGVEGKGVEEADAGMTHLKGQVQGKRQSMNSAGGPSSRGSKKIGKPQEQSQQGPEPRR